jgi:glycosyltransferase involved in cell wall biosynthesis
MAKQKVFFYTRPCYLDAALEHINLIKHSFELYVMIQLSEGEKKSNVLNLEVDITCAATVQHYLDVKDGWNLNYMAEYFEDCFVSFLVFKSGLLNHIKANLALKNYIKDNRFDVIHFDDFTGKQVFLFPILFFFRQQLVLNIHDPQPHSGEYSLTRQIVRKILYKLPKKIIFFSKFSESVFVKSKRQLSFVVKLLPYTIFQKFNNKSAIGGRSTLVSFVGRISKYKGVELFLDAVEKVLEIFPSQKFLIAGKSSFGYIIDRAKLKKLDPSLIYIDKHLTNGEMADFVASSVLLVCPYLDATQSGVILTSYALNTPVLVTEVGGLPEYVLTGVTGRIAESLTPQSVASEIVDFLTTHNGKNISETVMFPREFEEEWRKHNLKVFRQIFDE